MRRLAAQIARCLPPADARPDADLLAAFRGGGPGSEAAFAELVRRHGPMVWGVCRRHLPDAADAEDAFQAVFLVLVRKAGGLRRLPTLAPWLHRVAAWTARNVRRRNARRMARQAPLPDQLPAASPDPDLPLDLDSALLALPEKYRSPIVLCHLLGFTRAEAAARLNCPEGTLSGWLTRGLDKLRTKLGGLDPARSLGLTAAVPMGLAASAVRAAVASQTAAVVVPLTVSRIAEGVIHMFWVKKATAATTALFAVFAMGVGVGMSGRQVGVAAGQEKGVPGVVLSAPEPDVEVAIRQLEAEIGPARAELQALQIFLKRAGDAIKNDPSKAPAYLDNMSKATEQAVRAAADLAKLEERLAKLKAAGQPSAKGKPKPADPTAADLAKIDEMLNRLQAQLAFEKAARIQDPKAKFAQLERAIEELAAKRDELLAQRQPESRKPLGAPVDPNTAELDAIKKKLAALEAEMKKNPGRDPAERLDKLTDLARVAEKLAALNAAPAKKAQPEPRKPLADPMNPRAAELEKQLADLKAMLDRTARERAMLADKAKELEAAIKELTAQRAAGGRQTQPQPEPRPERRKPLGLPADFEKQLREAEAKFAERVRLFEAQQQKARAELEAMRAEIEAMRKGKPPATELRKPVESRKPLGETVKPGAQADPDAKFKELLQQVEKLAAERQELDRHRDLIAEKEKALKALAEELAAQQRGEPKKVKPADRPRP